MIQITFIKIRKLLCNAILAMLLVITTINATAQSVVIVGANSGANASNTYPCPLQDNAGASRAQYLYTAAEMSAVGYSSGNIINQIGWVTNSSSIFSHVIEGYSISVKNTAIATLSTSAWETGLTTINGPANYSYMTSTSGNVMFTTSNFVYTGGALVVEVCGGTSSGNASGNPSCQWTTGFTSNMSHTYVVTGAAGCGNAITTNTGIATNRPRLVLNTYCTPVYTNVCGFMWINNFSTTLGTANISNLGSACSAATYGNFFSTMNVSQYKGYSINFAVSDNIVYPEGMAIWVDWNQNGLFTDAGEAVWNSTTAVSPATFTGSFTVPATATVGATRMRVRSNYNALPTDPCATYTYGETEDYKFTVLAVPACSGTPAPGNTLSTVSYVCTDTSHYTLSLQNNPIVTGLTYQWQSSPTGVTYTNISGATSSTYYGTEASSFYYRCVVTCGTNSGISTPLQVQYMLPVMTSASSITSCSGTTLSLSLTSTVLATYVWQASNNINVSGETLGNTSSALVNNTLVNNTLVPQVVTYTATPTSTTGSCPGTQQTISVTVYPIPVMTSGTSTSACSGTAFSFGLISNIAATFSWYAADNPSTTGETTTPTVSATISNTIINNFLIPLNVTYTVTPTASGCAGTPQTVTVTVNPAPVMTSSSTTAVCSGATLSFSLSSTIAATYVWQASDNSNVTGETLGNTSSATIDNTLTNTSGISQIVLYTVTPTATTGGCVGTQQIVSVSVDLGPVMTSGNYTALCSGTGLSFPLTSTVASNFFVIATDNPSTYNEPTWGQNGYSSLFDYLVNISDTSQVVTYTVTPTSTAAGCVGTTQTVLVTVFPAPKIDTVYASPSIVCDGDNASLISTSTWSPTMGGYCTPTISNGCSYPDIITNVTFGSLNRSSACDNLSGANGYSMITAPHPTITAGVPTGISVTTGGDTEGAAVWIDYNQNGVFDATEMVLNGYLGTNPATYAATITIPTTAKNGNTMMRVRCVYSFNPSGLGACGSATFGETEDYYVTITGGATPLSYVWSPATYLTSTTTANTTATAISASTSYTLTGTSGAGCTASRSAFIFVNSLPDAPVINASSTTVCSGGSVTLTATSTMPTPTYCEPYTECMYGGDYISWVNFGTINNGTYDCSGMGGFSYMPAPNPTFAAGSTYPMDLEINNTHDDIAVWIDYDQNGVFSSAELVYIDGTGSYSFSTTITIPSSALNGTTRMRVRSYYEYGTTEIDACASTWNADGMTDQGETEDYDITISGGQDPITFDWSPSTYLSSTTGSSVTASGVTTATTYTVIASASITGCDATTDATYTITVNPLPVMTNASTMSVCSGTALNVTLTSTVLSNYVWIGGYNANVSGISTTNQSTGIIGDVLVNNSAVAQTVTYTVTPTGYPTGCVGTPLTITVTLYPTPVMTSAGNATICSGSTVSIPLTSNVASSYSWIATNNPSTAGESLTAQSTATLSNTITNSTAAATIVSYTVTPTSTAGSCSGNSQNVFVTVNPSPTMTSATTATICSGGTVSIPLTSNVASTYTWIATNNPNTTGESFASQSTSTLTNVITNNAITVQTVSYTVTPTASIGSCAGTPQTVNVTVNPAPTMTSATTATICSGGTVSIPLTSNVASTYSWIANDNPNTTGESITAQSATTLSNTITNNTTSAQTIIYTVIPTSTGGLCAGTSQTVTVTVNPIPTMTSANTATICSGGTVSIPLASNVTSSFTWIATNNPNTTGESFTSQSTSTLSNTITNNAVTVQTVTYTVTPTATTGGCVGATQTVAVTVNPAPNMTSATTATICSGGTVSIPLTSNVASSYTWIAVDNTNTTGESLTSQSGSPLSNIITNNSIVVQTVSYTVTPTATIGGCVGTNQTVVVTVNPLPTMTSPTTATICSGGTVSIPLTSNIASTYTWIATDNINTTGESITSQSTTTLSNSITNNTAFAQTVVYTVTPTSTAGSCAGAPQTITVTVNPAPSMTNVSTATICSGGIVNIPLTSSSASSYTWIAANNVNTTGESLTSQSTSTLSNTITNNTAVVQTVSYTVTPTAITGGCAGTPQTVIVTVNPAPTMTSATTATICSGGTVSIPLTSNVASSYTWQAADNTNTTGESLTSQSGITLSNTITNNSTVVQTVSYVVTPTATTGSCVGAPQTVVVTVNPTPTMTNASIATICSGGTLSIPLTSNIASTYTWIATDNINTTGESITSQSTTTLSNTITNNTTSVQTVVYTVTPTSTVGSCAGTPQTITITINPSPTMTSVATATICSGGTVNISLTSTSSATYTWIAADNVNTTGESLTSQSTSTLSNTITNNTAVVQTVSYTVTPTALTGGCAGTPQTVIVTINPAPTMTSAASATICSGGTVNIPLTSSAVSSYTWLATNNPNTTGESFTIQATSTLNNTITNNALTAQTVSYTVTPTSSVGGCVGTSQTVTVTVNPVPTMTNASAATICSGGTVSIPLTSNIASTYTWIATDNVNTTGESLTSQSTTTLSNTITNNTTSVQTVVYTVTPTSTVGSCAGTPQTITITINPSPTMTSAATATICSGGTVNIALTSSASATYTWIAADNVNTTGESLTSQSTSTLSNTITNNTAVIQTVSYTVTPTAITGGCAGTPQTVVVTVNPAPTMTSAATATICSGGTVNIPLTSNVASSYTWLGNNNPNTTGESFTIQGTSTLNNTITNNALTVQIVSYTVTPTSSVGGCVGTSQTVTVTVNPIPTMTNSATAAICSGATVSIPLTSNITSTYTWQAADNINTTGESITSQSTGTLTDVITNNTTSVQTVIYTATPTSTAASCAGTPQTITVTVNPAPTMTSAATATICSGGTVNIPLTSNVASTYSWLGGDNINTTGESVTSQSGAALSNTITNNSAVIQTISYTVTPTGSIGSCAGTPQTVVVTINPIPAMTNTSADTICSGGTVSIALTSNIAATYTWIANDNPNTTGESITSQSTTTLSNTIVNNTTSPQTVIYTVTPTSTAGLCAGTSQTITVTINPAPTVTSAVSATICSGGAVSIALNSSAASTFTWLAADNINTTGESITSQSTSTLNDVITNNSTSVQTVSYTVTPTAISGGCVGTSQTLVVTVNPTPTMTSATATTICSSGTVSVPLTSTVTSTYTWLAADNINTVGESTTLQGSSTINNTIFNITTGAEVVVYTVTPTSLSGCAGAPQTVNVTVNAPPNMTNISTIIVCSGTALSLALTSDIASSYSWVATDNPSTTGESITAQSTVTITDVIINSTTSVQTVIYTATPVSLAGSCVGNPQSISVIVNPLPTVIANATATTVCAGTSITLTGSGAYTYTWDNGAVDGVSFVANTTTNYTVTGTNINGCTNTASVLITVNTIPAVVATATATTVCAGTAVTLTATGAATYVWTGGVTNGVAFVPTATATYIVTGSNSSGCASTDTLTITVNPLPNVTAGTISNNVCTGTSVTLTGTGAYTYVWDNSVINGVAFTPTTSAIYIVTGTDINGCVNADTTFINVNPSIFTSQFVTLCPGSSVTVGTSTYSTSGTYSDLLTTVGGCDSTITTYLTIRTPVVSSQTFTLCAGSSVNVGASTYSTTGTYTNILTSYTGCDSTVTTHLTINTAITSSQAFTICNGLSITVGASTYSTTGTYTNILTSYTGCDSTVTTNLTVNPTLTSAQSVTVCAGGSITVGSVTHNTSGTYSDMLTTVSGCDSLVTTVLTVSPAITTSRAVSICYGASLIVGGNVHSTSGTFTDVLTAFNGCDSTVTTNLTINAAITTNQVVAVCSGGSVTVGSSTYTTSGIYTDILTSYQSCDSTVVTNFSVNTSLTSSQSFTLCFGGSMMVGSHTYGSTGVYLDTLLASGGCDSMVTTNLTVRALITGSQAPVVCAGGSFAVGIHTYISTGVYTDILISYNGCDSIVTTNLTVNLAIAANAGVDVAVCYGTSATISGSGSGGSSALTYSWSNGISTLTGASITVNDLASSDYVLTVSDVTGCSAVDTMHLTILTGGDIFGHVTSSTYGDIIFGSVCLFRWQAVFIHFDTVAVVGYDASGWYHFTNVAAGDYIIEAFADPTVYTTPKTMPTYYDSLQDAFNPTILWDSASIVHPNACGTVDTLNIAIKENTGLTGPGRIHGRLIQGYNYHAFDDPIPGTDIKLGTPPGGSAFVLANTTSSNDIPPGSGGYYTFTNLPDGDYYVYVDIPGLFRDSIWYITINSAVGDSVFDNVNYRADSSMVYIDGSSVAVHGKPSDSESENFTVYPNPLTDNATIEYSIDKNAEVRLDVYDIVGQRVTTIVNTYQQAGKYKYELNSQGKKLAAGVYNVTLLVNGNKNVQQVVVME